MRRIPAEWEEQEFVQLTWPNADTDWQPILEETIETYKKIAQEITKHESLVIVARSRKEVENVLPDSVLRRTEIVETDINDTWARDHGFITVFDDEKRVGLDFKFNGWGLKFPSEKDNLINKTLYDRLLKAKGFKYENQLSWVLEGGSIESDGNGTILTTSECLMSPNRNGGNSQDDIEKTLCEKFNIDRVLWVNHGYLAGDDTDSHIDTLARFAPNDTILYVQCTNKKDVHYEQLMQMENDLKQMQTISGNPYKLVALPMCSAVYDNGLRLPATYANFLFINGAILIPTYNLPEDNQALEIFRTTFPDREIVGIDCSPLIKQHGSLHCVTMQYPLG